MCVLTRSSRRTFLVALRRRRFCSETHEHVENAAASAGSFRVFLRVLVIQGVLLRLCFALYVFAEVHFGRVVLACWILVANTAACF